MEEGVNWFQFAQIEADKLDIENYMPNILYRQSGGYICEC